MRRVAFPVLMAILIGCTGCGSTPAGTDAGVAPPDAGMVPDAGGPPDAGVTSCTLDSGCGTGMVCENQICVAACSAANPCPGGFTMVCQSGHCRQRCFNDGTCSGGLICEQFVCVEPECDAQRPCSGTNMRCQAGRCEEFQSCSIDSECDRSFTCQMSICEERPLCLGDENCASGFICEDDNHCHPATACNGEGECASEQDCVGGLCVPHVCRGDGDCDGGEVCSGGACKAPDNVQFVFKVVILTPGGVTRPGETQPLVAIALDQTDRAVEGIAFEWQTDHSEFVAVDQTSGVIQGGSEAGVAMIRATAAGTSVTSDPVAFTNILAPAEQMLRLTVVNRFTGAAVQQAKASVGGMVHDVDGTATISDPGGAVDITVFHPSYDYFTLVGTSAKDLVIPLTPRTRTDPVAGLIGEIDLSQVSSEGAVEIGLAGLSSARPLTDFDLVQLFGDTFQSEVTIPTVGSFDVPVPGGMTLSAEVITGISVDVKTMYYVTGEGGLRAAWSLGGMVDVGNVTGLIGGTGGTGGLIRQILPFFQQFDHGVLPAVAIQALPRIADAADIDGDMDTTELVPDYNRFRRITLVPSQPQTLRTQVAVATLPSQGGTPVQGAVLVSGSLLPGIGFVPLGLTGVFDEDQNGEVDPIVMRQAPVHSGLGSGRYAFMALAATFGQGTALPDSFSARVSTFEQLPTRIETGPFLAFPEGATYTPVTRALQIPAVAGSTFVRAVFQTSAGAWEVYAASGDARSFTLPTLPEGVTEDLAAGATARLESIALASGTLDELIGNAALGLRELNRLMVGFARTPIPTQ